MRSFFFTSLLFVSAGVQAATLNFDVVNNGWFTHSGIEGGHSNTFTGRGIHPFEGYTIHDYNSFYDFDVSSIGPGDLILSVSITFAASDGRYNSADASETVELWDVTGPTSISGGTTADRIAVYNDLMSGTKYGEAQVFDPQLEGLNWMPEVMIELDSASFGQIINQDMFSIGAHLSTIVGTGTQALWSASNSYNAILTVTTSTVPVPAAVWLFGSALAGLGWMRRKQTV
jgi:hypothetical protein